MGEKRNSNKVLVEKPRRKESTYETKARWEVSVEMDCEEI
jgi:hypothetical protein